MFKLLWSAVLGGNPIEWVALGLGTLLALGGVFGAGYYTCDHMHASVTASATAKAVVAQEKHDKDQHVAAQTKSDQVVKQDTDRGEKLKIITHTIHDIETVPGPQNTCELSPDVAKLLNEAGHAPAQ